MSDRVEAFHGDSREVLKLMPECSVDSCATDPPYALVSIVKRFGKTSVDDGNKTGARSKTGADGYGRLAKGFMGQEWDNGQAAFDPDFWREVYRVLKPGAHLAAFSGTRTYHRMAAAIEDAGFEIRDQLAWAYGSGFPKSHDVSKGIDRAAGAERRVVSQGTPVKRMIPGADQNTDGWVKDNGREYVPSETEAATDAAKEWEGWGTALKPAWEPICLARKPLGTGDIEVKKNVERQIRDRGFTGEIKWKGENAASATPSNSSTESLKMSSNAEIYAENAGVTSTGNTVPIISNNLGRPVGVGTRTTARNTSLLRNGDIASCEGKSSPITERNAPAVESASLTSLQLTTSMAAEHSTGNPLAGGSTPILSGADTLPDTELFAGIATGLSDSMATVRIEQEAGLFLWPKYLPTFIPSKPLTVAANVLRWGTGAINVGACRVPIEEKLPNYRAHGTGDVGSGGVYQGGYAGIPTVIENEHAESVRHNAAGRWPANIVHDGSDEVLAAFPDAPGALADASLDAPSQRTSGVYGPMKRLGEISQDDPNDGTVGFKMRPGARRGDEGSAARFFYTAKAGADDRLGSSHPTVKPIDLMQWLVRLITPPGGLVLDPFAGTGVSGEAAYREGMRCTLVEREEKFYRDILRRIELLDSGAATRRHESVKAKIESGRLKDDPGPLFAEVE